MIENGFVYSAVPPLYKLKRGKTERVAYSDEQRDMISAEMRGESNAKVDISRFKGLGEISPSEFKNFIGDDIRLEEVTLENAHNLKEILRFYMGDNTDDRRQYIVDNLRIEEDLA